MEVIPIEQVFDENLRPRISPETRAAIAEADVIIGVDTPTRNEFTVFGTPALEETIRIGQEVALRTVRIGFDLKQGYFDRLFNLVQAIKRGQDLDAGEE